MPSVGSLTDRICGERKTEGCKYTIKVPGHCSQRQRPRRCMGVEQDPSPAPVNCCVHGAQSPWPEEEAGGQWKAYPAALRMEAWLDTGRENPESRPSHVEVGRKPED